MFEKIKKEMGFNVLLVLTLITGVIFIYSTYAWFSASLNVVISDFKMVTESSDGIYISLDGVTWSDEVDITKNNLLNVLTETYEDHKTQWSDEMAAVSSIGIKDANSDRFDIYTHKTQIILKPDYNNNDKLSFFKLDEEKVNSSSRFMAFDIFIKNVTPSPYSDNLYIDNSSKFSNSDPEDSDDSALNAIRLGIVFSDVTSVDSSVETIQNLGCNGRCRDYIYEPNAYNHTEVSIKDANNHGVNLINGSYYETYGLHTAGEDIKIWSGVKNNKVAIDNNYFGLQETSTTFDTPIFQIPKGIVKARLYLWVEGQDIDIIEHAKKDYQVSVSLKFRKDHASLN